MKQTFPLLLSLLFAAGCASQTSRAPVHAELVADRPVSASQGLRATRVRERAEDLFGSGKYARRVDALGAAEREIPLVDPAGEAMGERYRAKVEKAKAAQDKFESQLAEMYRR